jgi:undecaprenyl diphosphate synthase
LETVSLNRKKQSEKDAQRQAELSRQGRLPNHIAIIMDGNGRWAKERGNLRVFGHQAGVDSVRDTVETCAQMGIPHLTLFAFSTENWSRPLTEVNALMQLLIQSLRKETKKLVENDIRLVAVGQLDRLPEKCHRELIEAIEITKNNKRLQVCLALSYSGRWDLTQAVNRITELVRNGDIDPGDVTEELIQSHLTTAGIPDPDLLIRTGGEFRISNFLLWQAAYTELFISKKYWPDFRRNELYKAIESYQQRERRFGKISEQLEKQKEDMRQVSAGV